MSPRTTPLATDAAAAAAGGVAEQDIEIPLKGREPVQARTYGERSRGGGMPLVLHFHGGTFVCGDLDSGRMVARLLARAGALVVSLAYPLAPRNPFPDAIGVGYDVLDWMFRQRTRLAGKDAAMYLAGEEAGGNLAAGVALVARDQAHPPIAGQILLSPMLDPCAGTSSLRAATVHDEEPCRWAAGWKKYLGRPNDAMHPYAVPGASLRLARLAPTLVLVGQDDAMRDEALTFAERLRGAGNSVSTVVLPAASQWPQVLADGAAGQGSGECPCSLTLEQHFRAFFATAAPTPPPGAT